MSETLVVEEYFFSNYHIGMLVHLAALAIWYGTMIWVTFIGGIIMFKNMTKPDFQAIQAKLFPVYFRMGNMLGVILIASYFYLFSFAENVSEIVEVFCLFTMLFLNFLQGAWVGPWVTEVGNKRWKAEKDKDTVKIAQLAKEFGIGHGISSLMNLIIVICATIYLVFFSRQCAI